MAALLWLPSSASGSPQRVSPVQIEVVQSEENKLPGLQSQAPLQFAATRLPVLTIHVDATRGYQAMEGFGASLTESSAWLLQKKLTAEQRRATLQMLFDREHGIGLSILRQPMGASDFALREYSYDDVAVGESDPELAKFSIAHDRADILPILKEILAVNPDLRVIGSPWSPPGWMKTSQSMVQGALLPSAYPAFTRYLVKYIKAYAEAGIPIYAITMQNEPLNIPGNYPGMGMTAVEQAAFLRDNLGPAFREAGLNTKILVFDHNWDLIEYPLRVLSDSKAASFAAGTATHCYGGTPTAQLELHNRFPEKDIWMTECSGGDWQKGNLLEQQVRLIIGSTRNWAKSVVLWNLALNQDHQPYLGGCTNCRGVVTVNDSNVPAQVTPTVDYTALAHVSKFVKPGARRIESNSFDQGSLEDVAFQNSDGSIVLLVLNSSGASISFNIAWDGKYASYKLPGGAVATFTWPTSQAK
jgi:glucosylceramidase